MVFEARKRFVYLAISFHGLILLCFIQTILPKWIKHDEHNISVIEQIYFFISRLLIAGNMIYIIKSEQEKQQAIISTQHTELQNRYDELLAQNEEITSLNEELHEYREKLKIQNEKFKQFQLQLIQSEKMATIGTLTSGVAHEINNPLNFISAGVSNLQTMIEESHCMNDPDKINLKNTMTKLLDSEMVGVNRISKIISSLKTFSHKPNNILCSVNIFNLVDLSLTIMNSKMPNGIQIKNDIQPNLIVNGHEEQLSQVFINIIDNAIYALSNLEESKTKQLSFRSIIEIIARGAECKIIIFNNGSSIKSDIKEKIFDPFFTTKKTGEGTGLGLYLSYNIINEHKGKMTVFNVENGVEFIITFHCKLKLWLQYYMLMMKK